MAICTQRVAFYALVLLKIPDNQIRIAKNIGVFVPEEGMGEHSGDICRLYLEDLGVGVEVYRADVDILHREFFAVFFVLYVGLHGCMGTGLQVMCRYILQLRLIWNVSLKNRLSVA